MIQRRMHLILLLTVLLSLVGCGQAKKEPVDAFDPEKQSESAEIQTSDHRQMQNERSIEVLKEQYPEYFELTSFKGIEVYVWETADEGYRCGMMSGTNRMKTGSEIQALAQKSLSVPEAKKVLEECGIEDDCITIIPITQPYPDSDDTNISKPYIIDEERAEQIYNLFGRK